MRIKENDLLSLDEFIEESLYNEKFGYYMKSNPFGKKGDFLTAPNISILFSEMIAIWIIAFWENLNCPKQFNLIELGAGNGEMMKILVNTFDRFPKFKSSCNINILEKSKFLKKKQKQNIKNINVRWLNNLNELNDLPCIFVANEFFDALPIKQFIKIKNKWFERHVKFASEKNPEFLDIIFDMQKFQKKIKLKISTKQKFIEYSPQASEYLKSITNKIKLHDGGILLIDYGYMGKKIRNTLQAVSRHKYTPVLSGFGTSDITYNLNFNLMSQMVKKLGQFLCSITSQRKFLIKLGILLRAEIVSQNMSFSKKADMYFRVKRLIDNNQMGNLFKVMFITNKKNKFKLGF